MQGIEQLRIAGPLLAAALAAFGPASALLAQSPSPKVSRASEPGVFFGGFELGGGSFLGVGVAEIDAERSRALKLKEEHGVEITRVEEGSPAEKGGLKVGDAVLEYNGQRIEGVEQFVRFVRETPVGRKVRLTVSREGSKMELAAVIEERPRRALRESVNLRELAEIRIPQIQIPDIPSAFSWRNTILGVETEALDPQLAEFFGVKEGVLVRSVAKGSAGEKAGLKAGDVIVRIADAKVATPRDITAALRSVRSQKSVPILVVRERKELSLSLTLDDSSSTVPARGRTIRLREHRL